MNTGQKKHPAVMIAAPGSGSGKTIVTCALLEAFKRRKLSPCAFKCGPDYIDPMFHRKIIGAASRNLDPFFCKEEQLLELYAENTRGNKIAVIEGVMGLFDGIGGIHEEGSAYHVASILGLPILLVVDAHGMGRSLVPLLAGFLSYDRQKRIRGVLLNRVSRSFYEAIAPVIKRELGIPVLGYLPKSEELAMESRHLGLKLPETGAFKEWARRAADLLEECVCVEDVIELAQLAENGRLEGKKSAEPGRGKKAGMGAAGRPVVAVARDEAFCFYYEENLRLLEEAGADLVFFSPLHDRELPAGTSGLVLGGGYPELYAAELEKNSSMRRAIREAVKGGMPSVAECGGFLYLHETLEDDKGNAYAMCAVLPGKCFYTGRPVRFGYVTITEKEPLFLARKTTLKGHEFHYYDSENNGDACRVKKPFADRSWEGVHTGQNHFWGFPHLYYPSNPEFALRFVDRSRRFAGGACEKFF